MTSTIADQRIERIREGREASLASGLIRPLVDKKIDETLKLLVSRYRDGDVTHDELLGKTAEISALMGLLSDLETVHRRGVRAQEDQYATSRSD